MLDTYTPSDPFMARGCREMFRRRYQLEAELRGEMHADDRRDAENELRLINSEIQNLIISSH